MINFEEISPGDLLKILVVEEDVEIETWALVKENRDDYLVIHYFEDTSLVYKYARLLKLSTQDELIRAESICEHHYKNFLVNVKEDLWAEPRDIDSDQESFIYDESDESEDDSFIVSDSEPIEGWVEPPENHREIDKAWEEWIPTTRGASTFKDTVDSLEAFAKIKADENNF